MQEIHYHIYRWHHKRQCPSCKHLSISQIFISFIKFFFLVFLRIISSNYPDSVYMFSGYIIDLIYQLLNYSKFWNHQYQSHSRYNNQQSYCYTCSDRPHWIFIQNFDKCPCRQNWSFHKNLNRLHNSRLYLDYIICFPGDK